MIRAEMRITNVETITCGCPRSSCAPTARRTRSSSASTPTRASAATARPTPRRRSPQAFVDMPASHSMLVGMRETLLGRDPFDIEPIWHDLYETTAHAGTRAAAIHTISAIDIALHDLVGRALGQPVHRLLGGRFRDRVPRLRERAHAGDARRGAPARDDAGRARAPRAQARLGPARVRRPARRRARRRGPRGRRPGRRRDDRHRAALAVQARARDVAPLRRVRPLLARGAARGRGHRRLPAALRGQPAQDRGGRARGDDLVVPRLDGARRARHRPARPRALRRLQPGPAHRAGGVRARPRVRPARVLDRHPDRRVAAAGGRDAARHLLRVHRRGVARRARRAGVRLRRSPTASCGCPRARASASRSTRRSSRATAWPELSPVRRLVLPLGHAPRDRQPDAVGAARRAVEVALAGAA